MNLVRVLNKYDSEDSARRALRRLRNSEEWPKAPNGKNDKPLDARQIKLSIREAAFLILFLPKTTTRKRKRKRMDDDVSIEPEAPRIVIRRRFAEMLGKVANAFSPREFANALRPLTKLVGTTSVPQFVVRLASMAGAVLMRPLETQAAEQSALPVQLYTVTSLTELLVSMSLGLLVRLDLRQPEPPTEMDARIAQHLRSGVSWECSRASLILRKHLTTIPGLNRHSLCLVVVSQMLVHNPAILEAMQSAVPLNFASWLREQFPPGYEYVMRPSMQTGVASTLITVYKLQNADYVTNNDEEAKKLTILDLISASIDFLHSRVDRAVNMLRDATVLNDLSSFLNCQEKRSTCFMIQWKQNEGCWELIVRIDWCL